MDCFSNMHACRVPPFGEHVIRPVLKGNVLVCSISICNMLFSVILCIKYHIFGIIPWGKVLKSPEMWSPDRAAPVRSPQCRWTEEASLLYETCLRAGGEVTNQRARRACTWAGITRVRISKAAVCVFVCSLSDLSQPKNPLNTEKNRIKHRLWRLEVF